MADGNGSRFAAAQGVQALDTVSAAGMVLVAGMALGIAAQGGFFAAGRWAMVGLVGLAAIWWLVGGEAAVGVLKSSPAAVAGALAGWSFLRAGLAGNVLDGTGTALVLAGAAFSYAVTATERRQARDWIATALIVAGVAVAVTGWLGVVSRSEPFALPDPDVWRATTVLTYANASAAFLVMVGLVALARLAGRPSVALSVATMVIVLGAAATLSRAGALAGVVGLAVLVVLRGAKRVLAASAAPVAGALVAFAGVVPSMPITQPVRPLVAWGALAGGSALTWWLARRRPGRAGTATLVALVAAAAVGMVILGLATDLLADFSGRLSPWSGDRLARNRAAWALFADHPVGGVGPGPLWLNWARPGGETAGGWFVHNEYLQVLVQLGLVGGVLLAWLARGVTVTIRRARAAADPWVWSGCVAALAAGAVHSGFDFLWHVPVLPVLAANLVGLAAPWEGTASGGGEEVENQTTREEARGKEVRYG